MTEEEIKRLREYYSLDHSVSDQEIEQTLNKSIGLTVIRIHRAKVKLAEAVKNSILKGVNMERKIEVEIVGKTNVKKIKPCPFCGSDNTEYQFSGSQGFVTCNDCDAVGPEVPEAADPVCDVDAAIDAWNNRA